MGLSTFDIFKTMRVNGARELSEAERRSLQRTLLRILADVVEVAEDVDCDWFLCGGSALGALRHSGFLPWDDDLDIGLPRGEWRRFSEAFMERFGEKYVVYEPGRPKNYPLAFPRIRLKGTIVVTREDLLFPDLEHGAFVDVFLFENTFNSGFLRRLHGLGSLALGFLYSCRKHFLERKLLRAWRLNSVAFRLKRLIGFFLAWLPLGAWARIWNRWNRMCGNATSRFVTCPAGRRHFFGELAPRVEMAGTREMTFEGRKVKCPAGLENYMTRLYGPGYMTPPPEDRREKHVVFEPFKVPG